MGDTRQDLCAIELIAARQVAHAARRFLREGSSPETLRETVKIYFRALARLRAYDRRHALAGQALEDTE